MSFAVHFISAAAAAAPHPFGDPDVDEPDEQPTDLSADEIATWDRLHPTLVSLLPAGAHDLAANQYSRQLVHEPSGLSVTWLHEDYQVSVPYWSQNATAEMFEALSKVTEAIESETGLVGVDETSERRFLDERESSLATFSAVAGGFEQAMERQTVFGWLRDKFRRT